MVIHYLPKMVSDETGKLVFHPGPKDLNAATNQNVHVDHGEFEPGSDSGEL